MKIAVLNNWVPFTRGGAETLAETLTAKLQEYGHEAVLLKFPFVWHPSDKIPEQMLACRSLRLPNVDRAIGLKFPAYYIPHPNKVLWLLHQFRQAYELWGGATPDLPDTPAGRHIRDMVRHADSRYLPEARRIFTISPVTAARLKKFNGIECEVLFHPLPDASRLRAGDFGRYVFMPGRIGPAKRQWLAIEAMRHVRSDIRLVIAGAPDSPEHAADVRRRIHRAGLESRVRLQPEYIPEAEKSELLAGCLACMHIPYDEDSYGYVTLEAYHCRKPVITCADSGGTLILVDDGATGVVAPPEPEELGAAIDRLAADKDRARRMGQAGFERVAALEISWERVVACLTA